MPEITEIHIGVQGRPTPQGSKKFGQHGQLLESAGAHLTAWRSAVKRATFGRYLEIGLSRDDLPVFDKGVGVVFGGTFWLNHGRDITTPPDLDKLLRATWDGLTEARLWRDDGQVLHIAWATKRKTEDGGPGADLWVCRPDTLDMEHLAYRQRWILGAQEAA